MTDKTLRYDEILNCAYVLSHYKDVIGIPYRGHQFPRMPTKDTVDRIVTVQSLEYVLNYDWTLCEDFRRTLESVLGERDFDTVNFNDWQKVASRCGEWLPSGLTAAWRAAYHNIMSRSKSFSVRNKR
jgi:hypothetical protein